MTVKIHQKKLVLTLTQTKEMIPEAILTADINRTELSNMNEQDAGNYINSTYY